MKNLLMQNSRNSYHLYPGWPLHRFAWLPIPFFLAIIAIMWIADLRVVWTSQPLTFIFHYGSAAMALMFIVIPASLSLLTNREPSVLMLSCGMLFMEIGVLAMPAGFTRNPDAAFAIYNTSTLLSALCHLFGVAVTTRREIRLRHPAAWLAAAYASVIAVMGLVIWAAFMGGMPVFFIEGQGGTLLRSVVISASVGIFLLTAGFLKQINRRTALPFFYWYALGLTLLASGLAGSMLIILKDSPLQWTTRSMQLLGSGYLCVAVLSTIFKSQNKGMPLTAVEEAWRDKGFLLSLRQDTPLGLVLRYGFAVMAVGLAWGLRQLLETWIGSGLPLYIIFYPAVILVALLAGFGPGLTATILTDIIAANWILPPAGQFTVASPVDRLGLALFTIMGLFISLVSERYQRSRDKATAYDHEKALHESQARLATFAEATFEGIVESEAGRIIDCNEQFARILGYSVDELRGMGVTDFVVPEDLDRVIANIRQGRDSAIEHAMLRRDGTRIIIEAHGRPISPGSPRRHTVFRDITEHKKTEDELRRLNRTLTALSKSSKALMHATEEDAYLLDVCRIIVEDCGHAMVWIGFAENDEARSVRPAASSGFEEGYLERLHITWADTERGRGPTGTAIRTGQPSGCPNMLTDPQLAPWRDNALRQGFASSIALPLRTEGKAYGALNIYSRQPCAFSETEVGLLSELADDLAYGIISLRIRNAHTLAESALRESEQRVRRKLENLLSPEGDIGDLELSDIFDAPSIQTLMDKFCNLTRIPFAVIDLKGKVLVGAGWQEICTKFHRIHPEMCRHCIESDTLLTAGTPSGEYKLYKCRNNMWDVATPIEVGGKTLGHFFTGQFFFDDESPDYELFQAQAKHYGFDEHEYLAALDKVPRLSRTTVDTVMHFFIDLSRMISALSYSNIKLSRILTERARLIDELQQSREELESRVEERTLDLKKLNEALSRSNMALEDFAHVASHDLQEPLRKIMTFSERLTHTDTDNLNEQARDYLARMQQGAARMHTLILDLVKYSRVTSSPELFKVINLIKPVKDAVADLTMLLEENEGLVEIEGLPDVKANENQMRQLFQNLIGNALKYRSSQRPKIRIYSVPSSKSRYNEIHVEDNGIGFEEQFLEKIFKPFQRLHGKTSPIQGTGMGLAICRKIVEFNGGSITAKSEPDKGSTFIVRLPKAASPEV